MSIHRLTLQQLCYSQDSIARVFSNGEDIRGPPLSETPAMDVVHHDGRWYTLNNRTLFNLKRHFAEDHVVTVRIKTPDTAFFVKYTTKDSGCSVIVREKSRRQSSRQSRRQSRHAHHPQTTKCLDCSKTAAHDCGKNCCATCCRRRRGSCNRHRVSAHDAKCNRCKNIAALDCNHGRCAGCCPAPPPPPQQQRQQQQQQSSDDVFAAALSALASIDDDDADL